ncbi:MAG: HEAT repeat domain-containing protein [Bacteroidota bacterium]
MHSEFDQAASVPEEVEALIRQLTSIDRDASRQLDQRLSALQALERLGDAATAAIPAVLRMQFSSHIQERIKATESLDKMVPNWPEHAAAQGEIPFLLTKLKKDRMVANKAIRLLVRMGEVVVPVVLPQLPEDTGNDYLQANRIQLLSEINPTGNVLLEYLDTLLQETQKGQLLEAVADAIIRMKKGSENTVVGLLHLLESKSAVLKEKGILAIDACRQNGSKIGMAIPALIACLSEEGERVRASAIATLSAVKHPMAQEVYEKVVEGKGQLETEELKQLFDKVHFWVSKSDLETFRLNARRFQDNLSWYNLELKNTLRKPSLLLESVLQILANQKFMSESLVTPLLAILQDQQSAAVKVKAVAVLSTHALQRTTIIPVLIDLLATADEAVRMATLETLEHLDADWFTRPEVIDYFKQIVQQLDGQQAKNAQQLLLTMGAQAVPILAKYLDESEQRIIQQAILDILQQLGTEAEMTLPVLQRLRDRCQNAHTLQAINDLVKRFEDGAA